MLPTAINGLSPCRGSITRFHLKGALSFAPEDAEEYILAERKIGKKRRGSVENSRDGVGNGDRGGEKVNCNPGRAC